jgi:hypothetical protein
VIFKREYRPRISFMSVLIHRTIILKDYTGVNYLLFVRLRKEKGVSSVSACAPWG